MDVPSAIRLRPAQNRDEHLPHHAGPGLGRAPSTHEHGVVPGGGQDEGTGWPVLMSCRYVTAWLSVVTLTTCRPAGIAPLTSGQLDAGARKIVAPASRAPTIFCWMPPIGSTLPLTSISPVPAMNLPAVRFIVVSLSMIPSANIMPALGPPMSPTLNFTVNGKLNCTPTRTPISGRPPDSLVPTLTVWLRPFRRMVRVR